MRGEAMASHDESRGLPMPAEIDARPVEFPRSFRDSTRAEDACPVEFPLSLTDSTRAEDTRPVEFPLSLRESTRAKDARPVEFPLSLTRKRQEVCLATADSNILSKTGYGYVLPATQEPDP
ncbi:hypothetical protein AK812_SmicGene23036 [Symbiodinium microadriaticum]|uniref:Uncharacterized protein n=1 Tax=Symbiodinium microadriaticum TaxID=2951 RepID=A0A1Q9DI89_SYMMI|nr:hypothetical protein AK812_SmicGene23036 [Symbiodinium microadriaticum]